MSKLDYHIDQITRKVFREKNFALAQLITDWEKIISDEIVSRETLPTKIIFPQGKNTDGTLHIQSESAIAPLLIQKEAEIINNISSFFGYKAISKIKVVHK